MCVQGPARKLVRTVPVLDLTFEPPHHHRAKLGRVGRHAAGKPLVVEQFQERGEAFLVTVVGRCGEVELVLGWAGLLSGWLRITPSRRTSRTLWHSITRP